MTPLLPPEDPDVERAVRDAAATWRMPSTTTAVPWLARVERRRPALRPATRLFTAASLALAGTVALAVAAVWLNGFGLQAPKTGTVPASPSTPVVTASPSPSSSATPAPSGSASTSSTPSAASTPFPTLVVNGASIPPTRLVVTGAGGYRLIDAAAGEDKGLLASYRDVPDLTFLPDGRGLAISGVRKTAASGGTESVVLSLKWFDADFGGSHTVTLERTLHGLIGNPDDPASGWEAMPVGNGDRVAVGWTERRADGWHAGVDLVDGTSGTTLDTLTLPTVALESGGEPLIAWAPTVAVSPSGRHMAITFQGGVPTGMSVASGLGRYAADLAGDRMTAPTKMPTGDGSLDDGPCWQTTDIAFVTEDVIVAECHTSAAHVLRRVSPTGQPLGETDLSAAGLINNGLPAVQARVPGTTEAWFWEAFGRSIVRLDLATGQVLASGTIDVPAADTDPLARIAHALGGWIAPPVGAKFLLDPSIVVSPDGRRLYLVASASTLEPSGSSGVVVVDAATLGVIAHWPPTADYVSIGLSPDGSRLFAIGQPGVDASGHEAATEASLTVFDTATGTVQLMAGHLGRDFVLLRRVVEP